MATTLIFQTSLAKASPIIDRYIPGAVTKVVGRLVAVQHPEFEDADESSLREICSSANLPLRGIRNLEPFAPTRKALPPASGNVLSLNDRRSNHG